MALALIETSGSGELRGVWVADADHGDPDVAFIDEIEQLLAERKLGEAAAVVGSGGPTWADFLLDLFERQNHITTVRIQIHTSMDPISLLSQIKTLWPYWQTPE